MKPVIKQRCLDYWSCGKDKKGHYHATFESAAKCTAKGKINLKTAKDRTVIRKRNTIILNQWLSDMTMADISRHHEISNTTTSHVLHRFIEMITEPESRIVPYGKKAWCVALYQNRKKRLEYYTTIMTTKEAHALHAKMSALPDSDQTKKNWLFHAGLQNLWKHRDGKAWLPRPEITTKGLTYDEALRDLIEKTR